MSATNNVAKMPARNTGKAARVAAPVAPVAPVLPESGVFGGSSRNISWQFEGEGAARTLVLLINVSQQALAGASKSATKVNPQTGNTSGGNPVISSSGGFQYMDGVFENMQLGVSVNIIAKAR